MMLTVSHLSALSAMLPGTIPPLEGVRVVGLECCDELIQHEHGHAGFEGHGSDVNAMSVTRSTQQIKLSPLLTG